MLNNHIINSEATLIEALAQLNRLTDRSLTLFVVEADRRLVGSLTDGDIRRALLSGFSLQSAVTDACRKQCCCVKQGSIDPSRLRAFRENGITLIPVVNEQDMIADTIDLRHRRTVLPLRALLMAGGKGERLRPATLTTPKPLLEIEGKAIIDYNVEALAECGISDITVSTGYLAEKVENHFAKPVAGISVKCIREQMPLGTIGAASMLPPGGSGLTLVMNSDLLTTVSFEDMYIRHRDSGADATVAVVPYQVSVPYAILTIDADNPDTVTAIEEKPSYSYYANAGIYIFSDRALAALPTDRRTDATDLLEQIIAGGGKVTYYPIKGTWIDVGSPVDFLQAAELIKHHNSMTV